MSTFFYTEKQRYQKLWLWVIVFDLILCGTIVSAVTHHAEKKAVLYIVIPILILAFAFVIWIIVSSYLEIKIDKYGIHYRYPVFYPKWKVIAKEGINTYDIRKYDAMYQYGGWGVKNSKKHGKGIVIQGDTGLNIELHDGSRILIGTQNKDGIIWAMNRLMTS